MSNPQTWIGAAVAGGQGELLGHVSSLYFDNITGRPAWVAVQGRVHAAVVPLELSRFDGATLHLPYGAEELRTAPHHDPATQISYSDGEDLYRHYGLVSASPPVLPGPRPQGANGAAGAPSPRRGAVESTEEGVMIRSEEQLRVGTQNVVVGRARLVTYIVTEDQTFTVPVSRQEVRLVYDPLPEHEQVVSTTAPDDETYEVIRYAEQVLFTKQTIPVERVRMVKKVFATGQTVNAQVRAEQIDAEQIDADRSDARPGEH